MAAKNEVERDKTDHPTGKGTAQQLNLIEKEGSMNIVKEAPYITASTLYMGVQQIYQYDCNACDKMAMFPDDMGFCPPCFAEMKKYNGRRGGIVERSASRRSPETEGRYERGGIQKIHTTNTKE